MILRYIQIGVLTLGIGILFAQCADDDDNGNVIEYPTCEDGIQNGDEEGVDCGGNCPPCFDGVDFSGTFKQVDIAGRPAVNTLFGGTNMVKDLFNATEVSKRTSEDFIDGTDDTFPSVFLATLEGIHDNYGTALGVEIDYETNFLGLNGPTFTTFLASFDALQVAPNGPTTYYDGTNLFTGYAPGEDVMDFTLTLMFGGADGTRFDGTNETPQLTSDGVGPGDRIYGQLFPHLESPLME